MSKNLIIKVISYLSIVIVGSNMLGTTIDYGNYTKNPLKKVSSLGVGLPFSIESSKYQHLKEILETRELREAKLEERLAALEVQLQKAEEEAHPEQFTSLANVDQLLRDCRELLAVDSLGGAPIKNVTPPRSTGPVELDQVA